MGPTTGEVHAACGTNGALIPFFNVSALVCALLGATSLPADSALDSEVRVSNSNFEKSLARRVRSSSTLAWPARVGGGEFAEGQNHPQGPRKLTAALAWRGMNRRCDS